MEQTECCLGGIRLSGVLRPKQVASVGAQTKSRAWPCGLAHRVPRASPMRAASGCLHLQFRIILHYVPDFQPRTMILLPGTRNILPTKVTRKDTKKQHGSKPNHMRLSVTWFVASRLEARGVRRRIRARIAQWSHEDRNRNGIFRRASSFKKALLIDIFAPHVAHCLVDVKQRALYGIHFVTVKQPVFHGAYYINFTLRRLTQQRTMSHFRVVS